MSQTIQKTIIKIGTARLVLLELAFFAGLSGWIYWLAFVRPANLLDLYRHTKLDLYSLYPAGSPVHLGILLAFLELGLFYLIAWRVARGEHGVPAWVLVIGGSLVFGLILMYLFPYDAADIFDYIIHGRMLGVYGGNPFRQIPSQFPRDPFYPYVAWKYDPSPYGPFWELLSGLAARLAGDGIVANVWAHKLISGLFLLASIGVVAIILRREAPQQALAGTLLLAWNPVVLYETWGNGHNDMVMVFWMLVAAWAFSRQRYTSAILALVLSTLVKFVPVLLIPAAGLIVLRNLPDLRSRLSFLARTTGGALIVTALLYAPFWIGPQVLTVAKRTHLFTSTIPAVLYYTLKPHFNPDQLGTTMAYIAFGLTVMFALWQALRARYDHPYVNYAQASFNILTFYLLVTCLWFQQWYTLWLLGLVPLLRSRLARFLGIAFGFAALSKQLGIGPLLFSPRSWLPQPWLELWFTLGVLGIPWMIAIYVIWKSRRVQQEV